MEKDGQTGWTLALEENLEAGDAPVCSSLWSVAAPFASWSVPGQVSAPVSHQEASFIEQQCAVMQLNQETKEQDSQTEEWTEEKSSNTDDDWEAVMVSVDEYSSSLALQYESLMKSQTGEQNEHALRIESLEKKRDEGKQQYKVLIDKIMSLQEKLNLNSSKTTRKNFSIKLEELTAEKDRLTEGKRRLAQELEEAERKLKQLKEEQNSEKLSWELEITDLEAEKERVSKQVEEANQIAMKNEIAALESQRELAISQIEDWIAEAERYLVPLRLDPSPQNVRQRLEWEKNVLAVQNNLSRIQNMYNANLKLLQDGQQLDSLPTISMPSLPTVPTIFNSKLIYAPPAVPELHLAGVPAHRVTPPLSAALPPNFSAPTLTTSTHPAVPKPQLTMPTTLAPQPSFRMPTVPLPHPSPHTHTLPCTLTPAGPFGATGPAHIQTAATHVTVPNAAAHPAALPKQAPAVQPHGSLSVAFARNSSPQTVATNPPPTGKLGKLDKLLERLGMQFPQCTRPQLMSVLQQIKSERGTMAGLSFDEVTQQVSQRLRLNERSAPGPIAPPSASRHFAAPPGPVQRPLAVHPIRPPNIPVFQPRPSQAPLVRKLCLMCQNHVEPGSQYITNCTHTLHKECISVWLKSSKNNSCPFCPSK